MLTLVLISPVNLYIDGMTYYLAKILLNNISYKSVIWLSSGKIYISRLRYEMDKPFPADSN